MLRANIGCGQTPTNGWRNFDNSFSLRLASLPIIPALLRKLRLLDESQYRFVAFAKDNSIEYADATKGLPLEPESCETIYSSHMLEHLDRIGADGFMKEVFRVLSPGGKVRIAVPDIKRHVARYNETGDADSFIEATLMCAPRPASMMGKIRLLLVGTRHHQWMYDGSSLSRLLQKHGFVDPMVLPAGQTTISAPGALDLQERADESVYVEAVKPGRIGNEVAHGS